MHKPFITLSIRSNNLSKRDYTWKQYPHALLRGPGLSLLRYREGPSFKLRATRAVFGGFGTLQPHFRGRRVPRHGYIRLCMMHIPVDQPRSFDHGFSKLAFNDTRRAGLSPVMTGDLALNEVSGAACTEIVGIGSSTVL